MAQAAVTDGASGKLALIGGEQLAVAVDGAESNKAALVEGDGNAVALQGADEAALTIAGIEQTAIAIDAELPPNVALIDRDPAMVATGSIVGASVAMAGVTEVVNGFWKRRVLTLISPVLEPGQTHAFTMKTVRSYKFMELTTTFPSWVRVYGSVAAMQQDMRTQPGGCPPLAGTGFYAELVTVLTPETITLSPVPVVQTTLGLSYARVTNRDAVARSITALLSIVFIEP